MEAVTMEDLKGGSWGVFDPLYGPEQVLSIDRFALAPNQRGARAIGASGESRTWPVLKFYVRNGHGQTRNTVRFPHEPVIEMTFPESVVSDESLAACDPVLWKSSGSTEGRNDYWSLSQEQAVALGVRLIEEAASAATASVDGVWELLLHVTSLVSEDELEALEQTLGDEHRSDAVGALRRAREEAHDGGATRGGR